MNIETKPNPNPQPRLIHALRTGFDAVATHIGLILFPIALDLFLWFGPHFQIKSIVERLMKEMVSLPGMDAPQMKEVLQASQESWKYIADHYNLASGLRSYPIGVSSLMTNVHPIVTPLGNPYTLDVHSISQALGIWILFTLMGFVFGSLYFGAVAKVVNGKNTGVDIRMDLWGVVQVILLSISLVFVFSIIIIPAMIALSLLSMLNVVIAQLAIILFSLFLVWILVPLMFSPHGIYIYGQNAWRSILTSIRLVRYILPGTGLLLLSILILSQGLDLLWEVPPDSSWMGLVGIAGHAFVTTGLLAATFVYYQDAVRWVQEILQHSLLPQSRTSQI
jgi:hypothetical protein